MDLANKYFEELKNTDKFKRLIELNNIIKDKYKKEIVSFKTAESFYLEAKDNEYYPDKDKIIKRFKEAKINLYSKPEVKEYFILQNELDNILKEDFAEIRSSISIELSNSNHCNK